MSQEFGAVLGDVEGSLFVAGAMLARRSSSVTFCGRRKLKRQHSWQAQTFV